MSPITTTQRRGDFWKLCQAIGILVFIGGLIGFYRASQGHDPVTLTLSAI
jgi:hypothetical protein